MVELKIKIQSAKLKENAEEKQLHYILKDEHVSKHISVVEKNAYDKGFQEGQEAGYKQKSDELISLVQSLEEVLKQFGQVKFDIIKEYEPHVVDLALKVSDKILGQELLSGSAKLGSIIVPALESLPGATEVKIRLHPDDYSILLTQKRELVSGQVFAGIEIVADEIISKGGCIIESDVGMIDATLETRIKELTKSVKGY